jgi:hypothetical protein
LGKGLAEESATQRATQVVAGGFPVTDSFNHAIKLRRNLLIKIGLSKTKSTQCRSGYLSGKNRIRRIKWQGEHAAFLEDYLSAAVGFAQGGSSSRRLQHKR